MNLNNSVVTSTSAGGASNSSAHIADPPSLFKVHKNYAELQDLLSNLPTKLNKVSNQVDKEFLSSYRVHMLSIQTELKNLKHDVTKGEQLLNSDATVAKLEAEAKWFSDECGRLRQHHDSMFKDCEQIRHRLKAMTEQKIFLSEQLKALMKRNKILQTEIDAADASTSKVSVGTVNQKMNVEFAERKKSSDSLKNPKQVARSLMNRVSPLLTERTRSRVSGSQDSIGEGSPFDPNSSRPRHLTEEEEYEFYRKEIEAEELEEAQTVMKELENRERAFQSEQESSGDAKDLPRFLSFRQYNQRNSSNLGLSESMPNLSFNGNEELQLNPERTIRTASPKYLKKKVISEDRLLQTIQLPPHHLRHSNSVKKLLSANNHPFGYKKTIGEELEELHSKRKDLELRLEHSVREIFCEISTRKHNATQLSSTRLPAMSSSRRKRDFSPSPSPSQHQQTNSQGQGQAWKGSVSPAESQIKKTASPDHHMRFEPQIKSNGGITGLGLDQFSDNDRFAAVVKFLANPEVFHQVVRTMLDRYEE